MKNFDFAYLTPELFFRLDNLTWSKVRRLIMVLPPDKMKGALASASLWAGSVCFNPGADPKERRYREVGVILLVNQVNVRVFNQATRPEMDWAAVPPQMIYDFLVWHEIGHLVMGHMIGLDLDKIHWDLMNARERRLAHLEMERRADRYAWKTLFPGSPLPLRKNPEINLNYLDKFAGKYQGFFEQPEKSYTPLEPQESMILKSHLTEGIPWAGPGLKAKA